MKLNKKNKFIASGKKQDKLEQQFWGLQPDYMPTEDYQPIELTVEQLANELPF